MDVAHESILQRVCSEDFVSIAASNSGQVLLAALLQLPAEQIQAIELAFFCRMSHTEIGVHLALPVGQVRERLCTGLQTLKALHSNVVPQPIP